MSFSSDQRIYILRREMKINIDPVDNLWGDLSEDVLRHFHVIVIFSK